MKAIKRRFEQFLFYDYTSIETHLAEMAAKGWQLKKITPFYWEYRRTEPQKITYAVTYFSEASEFNPYPTENQQTFHEYCKEAGWNLITEWAQMQIFCTEQENPTPIETDELVKLKAIHRAMKKNFLPSSALLLLLSLFQIILQLYTVKDNPVYLLSNGTALFTAATWNILAVYILVNLTGYIFWYRKSMKSVDMGEACIKSSSGYKKISHFLLFLEGILIALAAFHILSQRSGWMIILGIVNITVLIALVLAIKNALKRVKASRQVNLTVTMVSCVVLSLLLTGAMAWGIFRGVNAGWFGNQPDETYTTIQPNGSTWTWDIFHDSLPLKVEDLQYVDYDRYSYEWTARESFILAQFDARQNSFPDDRYAPELKYEIVKVKLPALFNLCLNDYLDQYHYEKDVPQEDKRYFKKTDDPTWQADAVYQLYQQNEGLDEYILCWSNRIVYIDFDEIPTAEQIDIAAEKLSK
ncbi:hypothetical protein OXPF_42500 [Oxobacter pfennigii]|uniref:DUF2812 domain-containing protein n=1 Tax=Oxobacter pfennigii TaxID=36849 RepID=A0A0P9ABL2_9CLOT|nr:DUF2812 domain-containing protein [Oxobacter pfennigii]KPU42465.1 hypothetical protein OXPF_42500 [Oxobacter pfennigii]